MTMTTNSTVYCCHCTVWHCTVQYSVLYSDTVTLSHSGKGRFEIFQGVDKDEDDDDDK